MSENPSIDAAPTQQRLSGEPESRESGSRGYLEKVRYSHDAMIDVMIAQPRITQNELGLRFGYTAGWVSTIQSSDAFRMRLEARREELVDPLIRVSIEERFKALTARSLQVLQEKLSKPIDQVPDQLALKAAELGAKSLGLGQNPPQVIMADAGERLAALAERLTVLQRPSARQEAPFIYEGELNVQG